MGIGAGLVLTAAGAVLAFAIERNSSHGVAIHTIGWILMIVGIIGILLDLFIFAPRRRGAVRTTSYDPDRRTTTTYDREI